MAKQVQVFQHFITGQVLTKKQWQADYPGADILHMIHAGVFTRVRPAETMEEKKRGEWVEVKK